MGGGENERNLKIDQKVLWEGVLLVSDQQSCEAQLKNYASLINYKNNSRFEDI